VSKLSVRGDSHDKNSINSKNPVNSIRLNFGEALKLAERIGVTAAARELSLYESQLYNWRSKQQNQQTSSERELEMSTELHVSNASWRTG
jgi:transposase